MLPLVPGALLAASPADGFRLVLQRLRTEYLAKLPAGDAANALRSMGDGGAWKDIAYDDRTIGNWTPTRHLERLRAISVAHQTPTHPLFHDASAQAAVERGLRAWLERKPQSENWWHNTIGPQQALMPVLVLMDEQLPKELRAAAIALLVDPSMVPPAQATGQNLIWYATQQIVRGALLRSASDMAAARERIQGTLKITDDEGIQADFSFHQHGPQLYSGGYGLGFLQDNVRLANWLVETPWALADDRLLLLCDYALKGVVPLVRGNWLDWGARGREFTRQERMPRPQLLLDALKGVQAIAPASRRADLASAIKRLGSGVDPRLIQPYSICYWKSDFVAHQTAAGYVSVKMCSSRTVGTESGNGENLKGYWMPFGATFMVLRGTEYDGLPPVWDWAAIPGVTAPDEVPSFQGYQRHPESFVGCLGNGTSSVAAMRLNMLKTRARKAWFLHGDTMVALGAGIQSQHARPVHTTLNQTVWQGDVLTDQGPLRGVGDQRNLRWVWMNGVLYRFLAPAPNQLNLEIRRSSSDASNTAFGAIAGAAANVMTLQVDHGYQPADSGYAYAITQGVSTIKGDAIPDPAFTLMGNSSVFQAVHWRGTNLTMAVAHQAAEIPISGQLFLRVDGPVLLLATVTNRTVNVQVTVPTTGERKPLGVSLISGGAVLASAHASEADLAAAPGGQGLTIQLEYVSVNPDSAQRRKP